MSGFQTSYPATKGQPASWEASRTNIVWYRYGAFWIVYATYCSVYVCCNVPRRELSATILFSPSIMALRQIGHGVKVKLVHEVHLV
jgi:hypothetical protein